MNNLATIGAVVIALMCFAANSVFCRLALGPRLIGPDTYTTLRIVSGAAVLWLLTTLTGNRVGGAKTLIGSNGIAKMGPSWAGATLLFIYAIAFSFAYLSLGVASGALILFGSVQATLIVAGLRAGERPGLIAWLGMAMALGGLVYLLSPGLSAPAPLGSALMCIAGVAWGFYTLLGRRLDRPVARTAANFERAAPMAIAVSLFNIGNQTFEPRGVLYAALSGIVASGGGYIAWYIALPHLTATRAAALQLSVPVLAAFAGALFLSEPVSSRLVYSSALIIGGIALVLAAGSLKRKELPCSSMKSETL